MIVTVIIVAMLAAVIAGGEVETSRARLVAKVAAAMADRAPEGVAQDLPEAVPLAELMMTCLSLGRVPAP